MSCCGATLGAYCSYCHKSFLFDYDAYHRHMYDVHGIEYLEIVDYRSKRGKKEKTGPQKYDNEAIDKDLAKSQALLEFVDTMESYGDKYRIRKWCELLQEGPKRYFVLLWGRWYYRLWTSRKWRLVYWCECWLRKNTKPNDQRRAVFKRIMKMLWRTYWVQV